MNAQGYAFDAKEHGTFTPDGKVDIVDVNAHNREQEHKEIEWLHTAPERVFLYVKEANALKDFTITTWLGTQVSESAKFGPCAYVGFGYGTYRRAVDCRIFGVRYVGWYCESSGNYCRLRKAKRQA